MHKKRIILWILIFSLCTQMSVLPAKAEADVQTISITEFYNNGSFGSGYNKALSGAVVTISNVEEMRLFFRCLESDEWTNGIYFRQEADIFFSNTAFSYNEEKHMTDIYEDGKLLGAYDRYGVLYKDDSGKVSTGLSSLGISGAYIERDKQTFSGTFDGGGHTIYGCIISGWDTKYSGFFGYLSHTASVFDVNLKNVFLQGASGTICGLNEGRLIDCSAQSVVGIGWVIGGIAESTNSQGTLRSCRTEDVTLVNSALDTPYDHIRFSGIASAVFRGTVSACAVENLRVITYPSNKPVYAAGIVAYENTGEVRDCIANGNYTLPRSGMESIAGAIVGNINNDTASNVYNCIASGNVTAATAGGVAGRLGIKEGPDRIPADIENCVSLCKVEGNVSGGIAGEVEEGTISECYYRKNNTDSEAIGENTAGNCTDCYGLSEEQIYGKQAVGTYATLLDALNQWTEKNIGYLHWETGQQGYPTPALTFTAQSPSETALPTQTELESPSAAPVQTESVSPSAVPVHTPSESLAAAPTVSPSAVPTQTASLSAPKIKKLKADLTASLHVKLTWQKNSNAAGYRILRSVKKSKGYRTIAKCSADAHFYIDKKVKRGQTYYYKIRAYKKNAQRLVYGKEIKRKIHVAWYQKPSLRLTKGTTGDGQSYVQVGVSRYSGSYIEVYFRTEKKKYVKAPLKNDKIAYYNGKLRFSYRKKSVLYCKIRTYAIKKKTGRCYSIFSKEKKIRL